VHAIDTKARGEMGRIIGMLIKYMEHQPMQFLFGAFIDLSVPRRLL
jgi:hypothetical protein